LDAADGDISSLIQDNLFKQNQVALAGYATSQGLVLVDLDANHFEDSTSYPLYLSGSAFPSYSGNTFLNNSVQAIAVADIIDLSSPWALVPADSSPGAPLLPYLVVDYLEIAANTILQIPAGLVVKFGSYGLMEVYGQLLLLGTPGNPVVFTSIHDDAFGGDLDGQAIDPATDPWSGLELFADITYTGAPGDIITTDFSNTIFRYASSGLMITNASSTDYSPSISGNTFELNGLGVNILVGGSGDIQSDLNGNEFSTNEYGLVTAAGNTITGNALPVLTTNLFTNHSLYPIALQGSSFPSYSSNTFSANPKAGIGLQGQIHTNGTLFSVPGQGGLDLPYVLTANYQVNKNYILTIPAGTVLNRAVLLSTSSALSTCKAPAWTRLYSPRLRMTAMAGIRTQLVRAPLPGQRRPDLPKRLHGWRWVIQATYLLSRKRSSHYLPRRYYLRRSPPRRCSPNLPPRRPPLLAIGAGWRSTTAPTSTTSSFAMPCTVCGWSTRARRRSILV
jgi:hypothetical protein